jgi:hypothetical protein
MLPCDTARAQVQLLVDHHRAAHAGAEPHTQHVIGVLRDAQRAFAIKPGVDVVGDEDLRAGEFSQPPGERIAFEELEVGSGADGSRSENRPGPPPRRPRRPP